MMMRMCLVQRQTMELDLNLKNAYFESIFQRTEDLLKDDGYMDYMKYVCRTKKDSLKKYRSFMDFLFCELFPMWKSRCMNYYNNKGPKLKYSDEIASSDIQAYDLIMSKIALPMLKVWIDRFGRKTIAWKKFKKGVDLAIDKVRMGERTIHLHTLLR